MGKDNDLIIELSVPSLEGSVPTPGMIQKVLNEVEGQEEHVDVRVLGRKDLLKRVRLSAEEIEASLLLEIDEKVVAVVTEVVSEWSSAFDKGSDQVLFANTALLIQEKVLKSLNQNIIAKEDK